ncbi:MAG: molybdenum cofactor biosynthesis protein MoaE, partial [Gammaproteobacteria bacterium]|nr:molybdenum cofactor biosynthesis protein MoaE [Gammaproteobacteria bacterium]
MKVEILEADFEPFIEVSRYQTAMQAAGKFGAAAVFVGSMRDFNEGDTVAQMWLEHYPGMTEKYLEKISREAIARWDLL